MPPGRLDLDQSSTSYVALLRGINVGGKNKLPMKDLVAMFVAAGCTDVRSFIQSGNVIFRAEPSIASPLPGLITGRVAQSFGHRPPVILRTADELRDVILNNPFLQDGAAEDTLHVMFLADQPSPGLVDRLDPNRSPSGEFVVRGPEIYLRLPQGVAESKLTNSYFDSKLKTISTMRNWRTTTTLLQLMEG